MQYGIPYSLTTLHTEAPTSEEFKKDLAWFIAVCHVVRGMRNLRVGAIGARPAAFNTVRYSEKLLEANGISVITLDLSEVLGRISRMSDQDDAAKSKLEDIKRYVSTLDVPAESLMKMAKLGAVIDGWMREQEVSISAVQCWTSLEENFGVVPCTVMSMMSENLMSSACETDIVGVLSMHALRLASGTPSALLDWNNNYGDDPNKAVCFHCSNLPETLLCRREDGVPGNHRRHGRQTEHVRHPVWPGKSSAHELRPFFNSRPRRKDSRLRRRWPVYRRFTPDLRRRRRRRDSAHARSCCATSASKVSSITLRPTWPILRSIVYEAATKYLGWDMYWHRA